MTPACSAQEAFLAGPPAPASAPSLPLGRAHRPLDVLTSLWGSPAAEKMGIFWPRAMLFMTSMGEMPV